MGTLRFVDLVDGDQINTDQILEYRKSCFIIDTQCVYGVELETTSGPMFLRIERSEWMRHEFFIEGKTLKRFLVHPEPSEIFDLEGRITQVISKEPEGIVKQLDGSAKKIGGRSICSYYFGKKSRLFCGRRRSGLSVEWSGNGDFIRCLDFSDLFCSWNPLEWICFVSYDFRDIEQRNTDWYINFVFGTFSFMAGSMDLLSNDCKVSSTMEVRRIW